MKEKIEELPWRSVKIEPGTQKTFDAASHAVFINSQYTLLKEFGEERLHFPEGLMKAMGEMADLETSALVERKKSTLTAQLKAKDAEADSLRTECDTLRAARIETLVNAAVAEKKIGEDKKQQFLELGKKLGAEDLKATFDAMSPQVKLSSFVGNQGGASSGGNAEYKKLSEVPTEELEKLREESPAQYKKLYKAEYGIECEI